MKISMMQQKIEEEIEVTPEEVRRFLIKYQKMNALFLEQNYE